MNVILPRKHPFCLRLAAALVLALPVWTQAQDPFPTPTPTPDPLAGVPVQVLDQQQVTHGTHTVTFNRIAPPVFPSPSPTTQPQSSANTTANSRRPQTARTKQSAARTNDAGDSGNKAFQIVFVSATVYDHQFTALRWYGGNTPDFSVYVNIDFNYFAGVSQIETADTVYMIFFGLGDDTLTSLIQAGQRPPNPSTFPQGYSAYQIIAGDPKTHADDVAALEALCAYYDANKAQMITAYNQQQATNAAYQQWLQAHPTVQPNTVINYWPVKSHTYLPSGH